jgi:metal transporter CNNM
MGLVSIDKFQLKVILETSLDDIPNSSEREQMIKDKEYAAKIAPLVQNHHFLLVTLLLLNSAANEALPIFLDAIVPSYVAVIISVTLVLFFGEIIPSAIFTGSSQLSMAASLAWLVRGLQFVLCPVAWPIAKGLDCCLGEDHSASYRAGQLKAVIRLQGQATAGDGLNQDEVNMLQGALEMRRTRAEMAMTPLRKVVMKSLDDPLDAKCFQFIREHGYSRIPIYEGHRHNVRGFLHTSCLVGVAPDASRTMRDLRDQFHTPMLCDLNRSLLDVLNDFQKGVHIGLVTDDVPSVKAALDRGDPIPADVKMAGIITMEDCLEKLISEDILDESDTSVLHAHGGGGRIYELPCPSPSLQSSSPRLAASPRVARASEEQDKETLLPPRIGSDLRRSSTVPPTLSHHPSPGLPPDQPHLHQPHQLAAGAVDRETRLRVLVRMRALTYLCN